MYSKLIIFFALATICRVYTMEFHEVISSRKDYTIFSEKNYQYSPKKIFSFTFLLPDNSNISEVFDDACNNAITEMNALALQEFNSFKNSLETIDDNAEYTKKCYSIFLLEQSKLLKFRLQKREKDFTNHEEQLLHLPYPNVYILEYLLKIEEEKKQKDKSLTSTLTHHSFWWN